MYALYTSILFLASAVLLPYVLWRCWWGATYHRDLRQRLGYTQFPEAVREAPAGCLWFHAASVGEVQALQPIIAAVQARFVDLPVVLSTFTPAGKALAQRVVPEAAAVFVLPIDVPYLLRSLVRRLRPRILIVEETELWPNLFRVLAQDGVPIVIVNGRLSPRAFRRYRRIRTFMRRVLTSVSLVLVQSEAAAQRFQQLGAPSCRVQVVGSTNIDRALQAAKQPPIVHPLAPLLAGRRLLVGGSTHAGEETVLLSVYRRLYALYPDLLLLLAPRHLERVQTVWRHIQAYGYRSIRRSQYDYRQTVGQTEACVILLDTLGELAALYRLCTLAFVGGSLVPIGGHNILEPAVFVKPLFFGPYMQHFPELAQLLCQAGGAVQVRHADELYMQMAPILAHPPLGQAMGQRALAALEANRGALQVTTQAIGALLHQGMQDSRGG